MNRRNPALSSHLEGSAVRGLGLVNTWVRELHRGAGGPAVRCCQALTLGWISVDCDYPAVRPHPPCPGYFYTGSAERATAEPVGPFSLFSLVPARLVGVGGGG